MLAFARKRQAPPATSATPQPSVTPRPQLAQESRFQHDFSRVPVHAKSGEDSDLDTLLADIAALTKANADLRVKLDADPKNAALAKQLDDGRRALIDKLALRIALLQPVIEELSGSSAVGATVEESSAGAQFLRYRGELAQHEMQLERLTRWTKRRRIEDIDAELATSGLTRAQRDALAAEKKSLAKSLLGGAREYEQFDKRWAKESYGDPGKGCSNMQASGCGPTTLAILLNFLYAEDPETIRPGPIEFVTPDDTRPYAEKHGRVCGDGTNGYTMVSQVETEWPGFRGKAVTLSSAAGHLRSGKLVIFLCKKCTGTTKQGKTRSYDGHFMVLGGVDDGGEVFDVLDPGGSEATDIIKITKAALENNNGGFWIVERK